MNKYSKLVNKICEEHDGWVIETVGKEFHPDRTTILIPSKNTFYSQDQLHAMSDRNYYGMITISDEGDTKIDVVFGDLDEVLIEYGVKVLERPITGFRMERTDSK